MHVIHDNVKVIKVVFKTKCFEIFNTLSWPAFHRTMLNSNIILIFIGFLYVNKSVGNLKLHHKWPKRFEEMCGETNSDRIIGGQNAFIGQFPWMARAMFRHISKLAFKYDKATNLTTKLQLIFLQGRRKLNYIVGAV